MRERRYRASQVEARKRDAREKILLGGLVVKAGLRNEDKALILGALIDVAGRIDDEHERARLTLLGQAEFDNDGKETGAARAAGGTDDRSGPPPQGS